MPQNVVGRDWMRDLVSSAHPVLRQVCDPVERFDQELLRLVENLFTVMRAWDGLGLAAPQIGVPLRVFVTNSPPKVYVNPDNLRRLDGPMITDEERCLSLPGCLRSIERHSGIESTAFNEYGKGIWMCGSGPYARVLQHELDHLDGILITDREEKA